MWKKLKCYLRPWIARNTRFVGAEYAGTGLESPASEATATPVRLAEAQADGAPVYDVLSTPAMTPGAMAASGGASPLMTWGEVEGTPLRLEADDFDTPVAIGAGEGPQYVVPKVGLRVSGIRKGFRDPQGL
jgi:hypothetical protein